MEEQKCIEAIISGDRNRYEEIVSSYQQMVYRVCLKMTSSHAIAEDLAQEVFIKAYSALSSYRQEAKFSTWLYQITVRKCLDWRRAQAKESKVRNLSDHSDHISIDWQTPESKLMVKERNTQVHHMIQSLKEPYQTVVKLYYFEQCSYQEIALRTETPVKTIESQLYRAKKMMKQKGGSLT